MSATTAAANAAGMAYVPVPRVASAQAAPAVQPSHELTALRELHFLVHPLFVNTTTAPELAQRYIAQAEKMSDRAALCVFLHIPFEHLVAPTNSYDASLKMLMDRLYAPLERRLLIFDGRTNPFDEYRVAGRIRKELSQRGFSIDPVVAAAYAYGEVLEECVRDAAENLQEAFELARPITVIGNLTEAAFWWHTVSGTKHARVKHAFKIAGLTFVPPPSR